MCQLLFSLVKYACNPYAVHLLASRSTATHLNPARRHAAGSRVFHDTGASIATFDIKHEVSVAIVACNHVADVVLEGGYRHQLVHRFQPLAPDGLQLVSVPVGGTQASNMRGSCWTYGWQCCLGPLTQEWLLGIGCRHLRQLHQTRTFGTHLSLGSIVITCHGPGR